MTLRDLFQYGKWYHCIRHDGLVSNGVYDLEPHLARFGLADSYANQDVLDVGCADGYFSLLMKSRGARVVAIDSNKFDGTVAIQPSRSKREAHHRKYEEYIRDFDRFRAVYESYGLHSPNKLLLMSRLKGLDIEHHIGSIYDLGSYGTFDIVLCNDLLEHLRDPITAIEQVCLATRRQAIFSVSSALRWPVLARYWPLLRYQGDQSGGSFFQLSEATVCSMCRAAGFARASVVSRFVMKSRRGDSSYHVVIHAFQ